MSVKEELKARELLGDGEANSGDNESGKDDSDWEKPVLEDVSGKVMAQPYIRFT